jgi:hypothetical protein
VQAVLHAWPREKGDPCAPLVVSSPPEKFP